MSQPRSLTKEPAGEGAVGTTQPTLDQPPGTPFSKENLPQRKGEGRTLGDLGCTLLHLS